MTLPIALILLALAPLTADTTDEDDRMGLLRTALRAYVEPLDTRWDPAAVRVAWADLNGDRRDDAIVYLESGDWCGSGGCTVLVFEAMDEIDALEMGDYRPAAEISLMHGPIVVSQRRTNQWRDLIVRDQNGALRALRFDGETYPSSPGSAPRIRGRRPAGTRLF